MIFERYKKGVHDLDSTRGFWGWVSKRGKTARELLGPKSEFIGVLEPTSHEVLPSKPPSPGTWDRAIRIDSPTWKRAVRVKDVFTFRGHAVVVVRYKKRYDGVIVYIRGLAEYLDAN